MGVLFPGSGISGGTANLNRQTQTANTPIVDIFQAPTGPTQKMKCSHLQFECGGTQNNILLMSALAKTKAVAAVAAAGTVLVLEKDPGAYSTNFPATRPPMVANNAIATNDYIAYVTPSGTWVLVKVTSPVVDPTTGRVTMTIPTVGAQGIQANAPVAFFGISTDLSPLTGKGAITLPGVASTIVEFGGYGRILGASEIPQTPLMVFSANATAACILHNGSAFAAP